MRVQSHQVTRRTSSCKIAKDRDGGKGRWKPRTQGHLAGKEGREHRVRRQEELLWFLPKWGHDQCTGSQVC